VSLNFIQAQATRGAQTITAGCLLATSLFAATAHAAPASYPNGWIDAPAANAKLTGSSVTVSGWALDSGSTSGTGVDRVDMYVDNTLVSTATYGDSRPDMANAFGARFQNSGYHATLDLTKLVGGSHTIDMRAHSLISGASTSYTRTVNVAKPLGFGVNAHLMWYGLDQATSDLNRAQAAGLTSVRFDLYWSAIEPNAKGQYDQAYLTKLDGVINAARSRGITSTMAVLGTPGWARANTGSIMTPPTNSSDYADVMAMLAARYAGVPGIAYEVWNEPNQTQFWNAPGGPNAAAYTNLLKAAYPRIKSAAPSATVLGGSIAFNDQAFIKGMYAAGAKGNFDVLALHPYCLGYAPDSTVNLYDSYTQALQDMHTALISLGEPNKPIWITEAGWSTNDVTDATRATYIQQAVNMLPSTFPWVERFQVYALNQAEDMPDMGLTTGSGAATQSWTSYQSSSKTAATARLAA
jgi:hypothetical protein